ncbi:MAG: Crp/Fnr family transcriptional regulator [Burkholderiales bacterium]|nr:MAG: Crp/Fnr family transcriptional regulator [Burkholderiales bacterium]
MKAAAPPSPADRSRRLAADPSLADGRELHTPHERPAHRLGASRETVSRTLKVLQGSGWIRLRPWAHRDPAAAGAAGRRRRQAGSVTPVTERRSPRQ